MNRDGAWSAICLGLALGCGASPHVAPAVTGGGPPRPPGVMADPWGYSPPAAPTAATERGRVTLAPGADPQAAIGVVTRFFDAVVAEREEDLRALFDPGARQWAGRQQRQVSLETAWARRLGQLDYTALATSVIYGPRDVETYLQADALALEDGRELPARPGDGEVLVRVRIAVTATSTERLFGDTIVFLLRRGGDGYKIHQMREDFRLP